jgi:hypothetical protein
MNFLKDEIIYYSLLENPWQLNCALPKSGNVSPSWQRQSLLIPLTCATCTLKLHETL